MDLSFFDRLKIQANIWIRYLNHESIERWSPSTFRRRRALTSGPLDLVRARDHYSSSDIHQLLWVPKEIPRDATLSLGYTLPYYYLTGSFFKLYRKWPLREGITWSPSASWNRAFPRNQEGWEDINTDAGFARLRIQGPNPFLLRKTDHKDGYEVDYSPYFKGICAPVVCRFRLNGRRLEPEWINLGAKELVRPGDANWERAKVVANALDARYSVFVRHLLETHMIVAEAYAVSAYSLPIGHKLRAFLDLFTYGSLTVNDFAYRLLIAPASYFFLSKFISRHDAMTLFQNSIDLFSLDHLMVHKDVARRGIDQIPGHPYVEDGVEAWDILHQFVEGYVGGFYADDAAVAQDQALRVWYETLASVLPKRDLADLPLTSRERLVDVLCCLLYNNVIHEVCGDFSPFAQSLNPEHKKLVNFERLKTDDVDSEPTMADVFLYVQGAYASQFNNTANRMLTMPVDHVIDDRVLRQAVAGMQSKLRELDGRLEERNKRREVPFYRMMPRRWETSISF